MVRIGRLSCLYMALLVAGACLFLPAALAAPEVDRTRAGTAASLPGGVLPEALTEDYRIHAGDLLEVVVWRDQDLSREVRVRPDGKFSYPLIRTVDALGKTVEELQEYMKEKLKEFVKFPQVLISVKESAFNQVVVLGEVEYPGVYPYRGMMDILTAIGLAGDFTDDGKRESVLVVSDNFTDHPKVRRVNVFRSFRHGTIGNDFLLKPGDIVYVPKTFIGDLNKSLNDLQPTFNTIGQLMGVRTDIKTIYYNRDRPAPRPSY